jgi:hypothetical protein
MLSLINILILFFTILVIYQIFLAYFEDNVIEGLTNNNGKKYKPYNKNDALILAQQNAGNIMVLKQQIDDLSGLKQEFLDLSGNYAGLQSQVTSLVNAQNDYTNQMTGGSEAQITGTTDDTTDTSTSDNLVTN